MAQTIEDTLREVDFVARIGGDEFALLLCETMAEDVRGVLDKLQTTVIGEMHAKNGRLSLVSCRIRFGYVLSASPYIGRHQHS